jgi:hypothetical protein
VYAALGEANAERVARTMRRLLSSTGRAPTGVRTDIA